MALLKRTPCSWRELHTIGCTVLKKSKLNLSHGLGNKLPPTEEGADKANCDPQRNHTADANPGTCGCEFDKPLALFFGHWHPGCNALILAVFVTQ